MKHEITTWSFEMLSKDDFRPGRTAPALQVGRLGIRTPSFLRFLWNAVGEPWFWSDRFLWSDDDWQRLARDEQAHFWVAYLQNAPAGYFELRQDGSNVEIHFFGLLPEFIGKGYGGHLLNEAVEQAWGLGAQRVWLHTCSWDGPHAVDNYRARGFEQFDEKVAMEEVLAFDAQQARKAR